MRCPECGQDAIHEPPGDLVPWEAHGIPQPEWSHPDGSSLCPIVAAPGGYQPATPQPKNPEPTTAEPRPKAGGDAAPADPTTAEPGPTTGGDAAPAACPGAELAAHLAGRGEPGAGGLRAGTAGVIGREHMTAVIARLGDLHPRAAAPDAEPEAGS